MHRDSVIAFGPVATLETDGDAAPASAIGLRLEQLLSPRPEATFYLRVRGDAAPDADTRDGDILVVDRSLSPRDGGLVIVVESGRIALRRHQVAKGKPARETGSGEIRLWGTVAWIIRPA